MERLVCLFLFCTAAVIVIEGRSSPYMNFRGCSDAQICCQGRNNTCKAKGPRMRTQDDNRVSDIEPDSCFCDSTCYELGDCCADYASYCRAVDCVMSEEWEEYGLCSNPCGRGMKERRRTVLREASNGGAPCDTATEKVPCYGDYNCKLARSTSLELRETAKIIPATYGSWRKNKLYNPYKDIRRNLFNHHSANDIIDRPSYCARFVVTEASKSCQYSGVNNQWSPQLEVDARVCVECQDTAMKRHLGVRCRGHGVFMRKTRWNAIAADGCRGWWVMTTEHEECTCDPRTEISFILV